MYHVWRGRRRYGRSCVVSGRRWREVLISWLVMKPWCEYFHPSCFRSPSRPRLQLELPLDRRQVPHTMMHTVDEKEQGELRQLDPGKSSVEVEDHKSVRVVELHRDDAAESVSHSPELRQPGTRTRTRTRKSNADANATLENQNPLATVAHEQLLADAAEFARAHRLDAYAKTIQKGALLAQDPGAFETLPMLDEEDRRVLRREVTHKWDHPWTLYYLVVMCSIAAAVQGVRSLDGMCCVRVLTMCWVLSDV